MSKKTEDFIQHYGVKGMRWGIRNKSRSSKSRDTTRTVFSKAPKRLSDNQIKSRIQRMETEKRYNELNKKDISNGKKLASDLLKNVGTSAATTVLTGALLYVIKVGLVKKFGDDVANAIIRKKK